MIETPGVTIRDAKPSDAEWITPWLRDADRREIHALVGHEPVGPIKASIINGLMTGFARTAFDEQGPILIAGVGKHPQYDHVGMPWMIATDRLYEKPEYIARFKEESKAWVAEMQEKYKVLANVIDERNVVSIQWLKSLGFQFTQRLEKFGHEQIPFWLFTRVKEE